MRPAALLLFAATLVPALRAQMLIPTVATLQDRARPLLIFAAVGDARLAQQYADLEKHADEARARDMRIVLLTTAGADTQLHSSGLPAASVPAEEQARLRRRFHIAAGEFAVVLVGKDGGEKLRSSKPLAWAELASTIDAMPMRQEEMRTRGTRR